MKKKELQGMCDDFNGLKWKFKEDYIGNKLRNNNLLGTDYIKSLVDELSESWWTAGAELHLEKLMKCYEELDAQCKLLEGCFNSFDGKIIALTCTEKQVPDSSNTNG